MKDLVKKQVDEIVAALDSGKKPQDFADAAHKDPYVFVMESNGMLLVHPSLTGQNLKDKAAPVYDEVAKGTPEGTYVRYEWAGVKKCTYSRKTRDGLIVGCGYNE
jgi:signal transduction histidine kinase